MGRIKSRRWGYDSLLKEFNTRRYLLEMGAGKLSYIYGVDISTIKAVRKEVRANIESQKSKRMPKILVFDIETTPLEAYIWQHQVWNAHVSQDKILSEWFMLTWSAKWLFSGEAYSARVTSKEALEEDDGRIVGELWKLFDEADIVIAHNGGKFDVPNMNTRFLVNGYPPPSSYQIIDTLKVARREFGFTHNNLDALARVFKLDPKLTTDFDLWKRCKNGNEEALKEMEVYNVQDVILLEEVYLKLRPWIKSHPNLGLFIESDNPVCPYCGSENLHADGNYYYTMTGKYPTYVCNETKCQGISRGRTTAVDKEKRKSLVVSLAR